MKLIYTNTITSVSSTQSHLGTDYIIDRVLNNHPKQPYIASSASPTITVTCAGAEAVYIQYLAESVAVTFKNSSSAILSGPTTYSNTYTLTDGLLLSDRTHWSDGLFLTCPSNTNTVEFAFSNSTDVKSSLDSFESVGSDNRGRLKVGSSTIAHADYPQIRLGAFLNNSLQINRITGVGSGTSDVQLTTGGNSTFSLTNMKLPVAVNTIRAGKVLTTFNPNVGMSIGKEMFGVQQAKDSGLSFRLGETRRVFSGSVQILESERTTANRILSGLRMQPVAAEILSYQSNTSVFGSFFTQPSFAYSSQGSQLYSVNFEFTELI